MSGHEWNNQSHDWRCSRCGSRLHTIFMPRPEDLVKLSPEDTLRTFDGVRYVQWATCEEVTALRVLGS